MKQQRQEASGKGSKTTAASSSGNGAADDEAATPAPSRKGTSYQDRVDAAARYSGKPSKAAAGNGVPLGTDPNPNSKASRKARRKSTP
jgi:hypothetical protein